MPDRIIKDSIKRSKTISDLTWFEEVCFYRLIVTADDYGRFYRDPQLLKNELFPRVSEENLPIEDIENAFKKLEKVRLITSYRVKDETYLQVVTWKDHQRTRAKKSKYPDKDGKITTRVSNLPTSDDKCQQNADIGQQMCPNAKAKANANTKAKTKEDDRQDGFELTEEDAQQIQSDHSEILEKMEYVGFEMTQATMDRVIDLYAQHGKEAVLAALDECTGVNGNKLRYLTKVLANMGTPKPEEGKAYMSDEEEQSISSRLVFGDEEDL